MAPPNRPPVRRPGARPAPPPRSDTEPEARAVEAPELSVASRRRVARRAKEPEKKKSKGPLVLVLVLLVAAAGGGYWKMTQKPVVVVVDPSIAETAELQAMFQDGKNLVRKGQWAEAGAKFNEVLARQPDFGDGAVKTYLTATEKEIPNQKHFDDAAAALAKNEIGNAHRALAAVSADTQQVNRRDQLQAKEAELFKARILEAQGLVQGGGEAKMRKLKALAEDLLVARPEDRDALEFKAIADRALRPRGPDTGPVVPKDDPAIKVMATYASGDAGGALAAAAACAAESESCRMIEGKMSELNGLLKRIEALQPAELETGLRLDRQISGGKASPQSKPIATRAATVFYKKASAAKTVGDWAQVMVNAFKVVDAEPAHTGGQAMVSEGRERGRELYLRCYQLKQTEPEQAVPLCNEVIAMFPPGDPQREKAEKVIQALKAK